MLIDFRQLFPKYNLKFNGVLHVGANVGEEAPVYHELGMGLQVWVEANPKLMPQLRSNIVQYPAVAFNFCLGDEDGKETMLHVSNNAGQSSSVLPLGTHKVVHPDVHYVEDIPMVIYRAETLLTPELIKPCDFLNIDVQGYELQVLRGMGSLLRQFKAVYLEVNTAHLYEGCALLADIDLFMTANGLRRVETKILSGLNWGDALYIR